MKRRILIAEDEELMRAILRRLFEGEGFEVSAADSAENAIKALAEQSFDVVITDIKMAGMTGIDLLDRIKTLDEYAMVIIITAFSSVETAVAALRKGAYDYVTKPFVNEELLQTVNNALTQRQLFLENRSLRRELDRHFNVSEFVGESDALKKIFSLVKRVAEGRSTILITGETGTGKELIARSIHFNSSRSSKPFLAVNCGAMSESLLESELFGHERGAFTGAIQARKGLFRSADGGTVFLDEVGDMPVSLQVKLLRAIQEHEVTPVGASYPIRFDARIVAATNRDLEADVRNGLFREDLFYRLNVIEINVPPLRERRSDIPALARHFAMRTARMQDQPLKEISQEAMALLMDHDWPGNVRELENCIERAFLLAEDTIEAEDLPAKILDRNAINRSVSQKSEDGILPLDEIERRHIHEVLSQMENDKVKASKALGIDLSTLYRKLKRFELTDRED